MKSGRILIFFGLLLIGIVIYVNKFQNSQSEVNTQAQKTPPPMSVTGIVVSSQSIEDKIFASGSLIAKDEVEIRNEIPGKITSILFKEGTRVRKGETLLTLYNSDLLAQLKKLQLQKEVAQKTEERQKDLLTVNGISKQDYELSQNQWLTILADIDLIESNISKTRIEAPFDGIIGLKTVSTGAFLAINTRIASIQSVNPIKLEFALPERYRSMISDTSSINFTTESSEGIFRGKIYAFEPKIDLQTRSVFVRALCSNDQLKLYPGAFVHVEIPLKKIENAILIPTQALIPELKGQKVFITKNGKAEKIAVETGIRNDSTIQIKAGLTEGDTVLITGLMQMRQGMSLKVNIKNQSNNN